MKKRFSLTPCALLVLGLAACAPAEETPTDPVPIPVGHVHTVSEEWEIGPKSHWHLCPCGEELDEAEHELADEFCTVCGAQVFSFDDGTTHLYVYNDLGYYARSAAYAADGTLEWCCLCEYNDTGTWMREEEYTGAGLVAERTYLFDEEGMQSLITEISFREDGSQLCHEYDLYGNLVIEIENDPLGNVLRDLRYERLYDEAGRQTLVRTVIDGQLTEEMEFLHGEDEDGPWSVSGKTTTYHDDGSKTVTDGDREATWSSETTYAPDGTLVEDLRYEYERDEIGDTIGTRTYRNGVLSEEARYIKDESGETIVLFLTEYGEDGGKTVRELDGQLDLLRETVYDAQGNVVSVTEGPTIE